MEESNVFMSTCHRKSEEKLFKYFFLKRLVKFRKKTLFFNNLAYFL